jgi:hypothetical protein
MAVFCRRGALYFSLLSRPQALKRAIEVGAFIVALKRLRHPKS